MLKITGDGRKAALDMRLVDAFADAHGDTKLSRAVERIRATWDATRNERSTQLVFCDLSTPHPGPFQCLRRSRAPGSSPAEFRNTKSPSSTTPTATPPR